MVVIWIGVIVLLVVFATLAGRSLAHGNEPGNVPAIVSLFPMLSAIAILVGGLIRWVMKRDRYLLLISKQHEKKWSCATCQNVWTSRAG